jgi:predicted O-methyltransferase YrrM
MFRDLPKIVLDRMQYLEEIDARDRQDGTPRSQRLRQISPETGKFLALLVASAPEGACVEIGTSAGYSTLWLALGCQQSGRQLITFEMDEEKVKLAEETFRLTGVTETVDLVIGDARERLCNYENIAFCFLDAEKEMYGDFYDLVIPKIVRGGLLVADNVIQFQEAVQPMLDTALSDPRVDALIVPIGTGELLCRKI